MNEQTNPRIEQDELNGLDGQIGQAELQASLERLGVKELEERMEVSPLLGGPDVQVTDRCECGVCGCSYIDADLPNIQIMIEDDLGGVNHLGI